jgi:hypothetical protein
VTDDLATARPHTGIIAGRRARVFLRIALSS